MFWRGRRDVQLAVATLVLIPVVGLLALRLADRSAPLRVEGAVAPRVSGRQTSTTTGVVAVAEGSRSSSTDFADAGGTVSAAAGAQPSGRATPQPTTRDTSRTGATGTTARTTVTGGGVPSGGSTTTLRLDLRTTTTQETSRTTETTETTESTASTETTQQQTQPTGTSVTTIPPDGAPATQSF